MSNPGVYQVQCPRCHVIAFRGTDFTAGKRLVWRLCEACDKKVGEGGDEHATQ